MVGIQNNNIFSNTLGQILWAHWSAAYEYSVSRDWRIHPKLTKQHVDPAQLDKMRNHLAEEVLDKNMLYLMKVSHYSLLICPPKLTSQSCVTVWINLKKANLVVFITVKICTQRPPVVNDQCWVTKLLLQVG